MESSVGHRELTKTQGSVGAYDRCALIPLCSLDLRRPSSTLPACLQAMNNPLQHQDIRYMAYPMIQCYCRTHGA